MRDLRFLLKGGDKDPSLVKSCRPVTLVPFFGKVCERLIDSCVSVCLDRVGG